MGFKPEMFTVLFAIPRRVGWLAQWQEMLQDSEQKIARPRQLFAGSDVREVVPIDKRMAASGRRCVRKFRILQERLGVESRL
jgi:citrate synthase